MSVAGEPDGDSAPDEEGADSERLHGIFIGLSAGAGSAGGALSGGLTAMDAIVNPGAARAREELDQQHERVVPTPSPGDRMLEDGLIVIEVPVQPDVEAPDADDDTTILRSSKGASAP